MTLVPAPPHDTITPDVETSGDDYRRRFAGPAGGFLLEQQIDAVAHLVNGANAPLRVLEVGGGHGQLTSYLLDRGFDVWVQGSASECARQVRPLMDASGGRLRFVTSNLWSLPFATDSFDLVIAIRLLSHIERWEALLAEMGRVTRRSLLVDYASLAGPNALTPVLFRIKRRIEGNTRPYFCYTRRRLAGYLRGLGFRRTVVRKQFWAPMGLHRMLSMPRWSNAIEAAGRSLGLTRLFGSPAMLLAEKG